MKSAALLISQQRPLFEEGYECVGGPLDGATLYLSERSRNTARIECKALHGRYVVGRYMTGNLGQLVWEGTA